MFQFLKIGLPSSKDWFPIKPTRKNRGIMSELLVLWTTVYAIAELHSYNPWCCLEHQATNMSPIFRQERTLSEPGPAASQKDLQVRLWLYTPHPPQRRRGKWKLGSGLERRWMCAMFFAKGMNETYGLPQSVFPMTQTLRAFQWCSKLYCSGWFRISRNHVRFWFVDFVVLSYRSSSLTIRRINTCKLWMSGEQWEAAEHRRPVETFWRPTANYAEFWCPAVQWHPFFWRHLSKHIEYWQDWVASILLKI